VRIAELSRRSRVNERLLRYYEEQGLLRPARGPAGHREYGEADVVTVRQIRAMLTAGLRTTTIAQVLPCIRDDAGPIVSTSPQLLADVRRERQRISREIEQLDTSQQLLDQVIGAASPEFLQPAG
jgi:DNA-binding transcriptional MerR regulator